MVEIRAAAVTLSLIVIDLIEALLSIHAEISVVARLEHRTEIETMLVAASPDLVLLGLRHDEGDEVAQACLTLLPGAKVIALSSDGRVAGVHTRNAAPTILQDFSPRQLIDAILEGRPGQGSSSVAGTV